jgi:hypothetical protein
VFLTELVWKLTMLFTANDSNEINNTLARGGILNFLNSYLQERRFVTSAIVQVTLFWVLRMLNFHRTKLHAT